MWDGGLGGRPGKLRPGRWVRARFEISASIGAGLLPLSFAPGAPCPFNWSHEVVALNGATMTAGLARPS